MSSLCVFFFKQNTAYELRISDWSSDVCSSDLLYLNAEEWDARIGSHAAHLTTPFHEPESEQVVDFGVDNARDFAPERAQNANVYEAVGKHIASLQRADKKVIIASYSVGARERLQGLLADHGVKRMAQADDWQEALGRASGGTVALSVLPLYHGFTPPDVAGLPGKDMQ